MRTKFSNFIHSFKYSLTRNSNKAILSSAQPYSRLVYVKACCEPLLLTIFDVSDQHTFAIQMSYETNNIFKAMDCRTGLTFGLWRRAHSGGTQAPVVRHSNKLISS